jgi:hypothetical protein
MLKGGGQYYEVKRDSSRCSTLLPEKDVHISQRSLEGDGCNEEETLNSTL